MEVNGAEEHNGPRALDEDENWMAKMKKLKMKMAKMKLAKMKLAKMKLAKMKLKKAKLRALPDSCPSRLTLRARRCHSQFRWRLSFLTRLGFGDRRLRALRRYRLIRPGQADGRDWRRRTSDLGSAICKEQQQQKNYRRHRCHQICASSGFWLFGRRGRDCNFGCTKLLVSS